MQGATAREPGIQCPCATGRRPGKHLAKEAVRKRPVPPGFRAGAGQADQRVQSGDHLLCDTDMRARAQSPGQELPCGSWSWALSGFPLYPIISHSQQLNGFQGFWDIFRMTHTWKSYLIIVT